MASATSNCNMSKDPDLLNTFPATRDRRQVFSLLSSARKRTMMRPSIYPQYRNRDWDIILCFASYCNLNYSEVVSLLKKNKSDLKMSELYRSYIKPSRENDILELVNVQFELNNRVNLIGKTGVNGDHIMLELDFSMTMQHKFIQFASDRPTVNWQDHEIKSVLGSWAQSLNELQNDINDDFYCHISAAPESLHPIWLCILDSKSHHCESIDLIKTQSLTRKLLVSYLQNMPQGKRRWGGRISFDALRAMIYAGEPKITRVPCGRTHSHAANEIIRTFQDNMDTAPSKDILLDVFFEQANLCLEFAIVTLQEYDILKHWVQIDDCFDHAIARNSISFYPDYKFISDLELEHFLEFVRQNPDFVYSPKCVNETLEKFKSSPKIADYSVNYIDSSQHRKLDSDHA